MLLTGILLYSITSVAAQDTTVVRDLQLWSGAKIEKSFAKDWTLSLEEEIRFRQNISEISNFFTELGLRYKINKNFALAGAYRYTRDRKRDDSYKNMSRYNLDLRYKGKIKFLGIYYRLRYQKEVEGFNLFDMDALYVKHVRNRISLRYNDLNDLEPYVSAEIFQAFTPYQSPRFDYYRIVLGIRYEPGNIGEFKLAWGFNREFSSYQAAMVYMFKVNYTYKF